ncbi:MAG: hypothetical protein SXG53_14865 [Pseudomonadota bacterium]|nr:hypothetical protein [Pseudomonadota bacterium]
MTSAELDHKNIQWMSNVSPTNIVTLAVAGNCRVIALDGFMGSGKSPLSLMLEFQLGVECIHIDDFLPPASTEAKKFIDVLDLDRMVSAVESRKTRGPVLIEGILLRDVLARLPPLDPVLHIYVAAAWRPGPEQMRWNEGDRLAQDNPPNSLDGQIVEYHHRLLPHKNYDLAVLRDQDQFKRFYGPFIAPDGQLFQVPGSVVSASRLNTYTRKSGAFRCTAADVPEEALGLIKPPLLSPETRSLDTERLRSVLTGIVNDSPLPPVVLCRTDGAAHSVLLDGSHRYFSSVAVGFMRVPAKWVTADDAELLYRYTPGQ